MKRLTYLAALALIMLGCGPKKTQEPTQANNEPQTEEIVVPEQEPVDLSQCDMVMLDKGKLFFYNSEMQVLTPYEAEKDNVVNSVFLGDNKVYYCVASEPNILLRCIDLEQPNPQPQQLADWGIPYEDCVTETYGTVSPLEYYPGRNKLGLWYDFSWESFSLTKQKIYDMETGKVAELDWETWEKEGNALQEAEEQNEENYRYISTKDELQEYLSAKDGNYYFTDVKPVCLTNQIDFDRFISDPEYASGKPDFEYISSSPDNTKVLYMAILEWGDYPHGPLCISSTDGSYQVALEDTDCSEFKADWLSDGSLVYVGYEQVETGKQTSKWENSVPVVKRVYPDGTWESFFRGDDFQLKQSVVH